MLIEHLRDVYLSNVGGSIEQNWKPAHPSGELNVANGLDLSREMAERSPELFEESEDSLLLVRRWRGQLFLSHLLKRREDCHNQDGQGQCAHASELIVCPGRITALLYMDDVHRAVCEAGDIAESAHASRPGVSAFLLMRRSIVDNECADASLHSVDGAIEHVKQ